MAFLYFIIKLNSNFLPLTAGPTKKLTENLYVTKNTIGSCLTEQNLYLNHGNADAGSTISTTAAPSISFRKGSNAASYSTKLTPHDNVDGDRVIALPNKSGTIALTSDIIDLAHGGTGATTAAAARTNLGLGDAAIWGATDQVSDGNNKLVTSWAVYSALKNFIHTQSSSEVSYNIAANGNATVNIPIPTKSGYSMKGVLTLNNTNTWVAITSWSVVNSNLAINCHNTSTSSAASGKIAVIFWYSKSM